MADDSKTITVVLRTEGGGGGAGARTAARVSAMPAGTMAGAAVAQKEGTNAMKAIPLIFNKTQRMIMAATNNPVMALNFLKMMAPIILIGDILIKALKPLFKMVDILTSILGAALMPITMIFVNLMRPLLYMLIPLVRWMWNLWRPHQQAIAEAVKTAKAAGVKGNDLVKVMLGATVKESAGFLADLFVGVFSGVGDLVTGGALGGDTISTAIKALVGAVVLLFVIPAGLASIGVAIAGLFDTVVFLFGQTAIAQAAGKSLATMGATLGATIGALFGAVIFYFTIDYVLKGIGFDATGANILALVNAVAFAFALINPVYGPIFLAATLIMTAITALFKWVSDQITASIPKPSTPAQADLMGILASGVNKGAFGAASTSQALLNAQKNSMILGEKYLQPFSANTSTATGPVYTPASGTGGGTPIPGRPGYYSITPVEDFVLSNNRLIKADPNDTIMGSKSGFGGGSSPINITVNATTNDPRELARMVGVVVREQLESRSYK